jgi:hypothetical protein
VVIKEYWKRRFNKWLAKVSQPEYREHYLNEVAPKLERRFGVLGRWWNKWHDPQHIDGTICPYCSVKNGALKETMPDFLSGEMDLVSKSKSGRCVEKFCDHIVIGLLKSYFRRVSLKERRGL